MLATSYSSDRLNYSFSRSLRSYDQMLLPVPEAKLKLKAHHAFAVAAPKLMNSSPALS